MSPTDPQTDIRPGDELVAYLDGELAPEECRRVEDRLASDADYRRQLHELDQAWEALDALAKPAANENFARTTIEMVSVAAQQDVSEQTAAAAAERQRRFWGWAAAAITAAALGFVAARSLIPDSNEKLLADLPVIQQFDVLSQIESVDFLRRLPPGVTSEPSVGDRADMDREAADMKAAASGSLDSRREWVESLAPDAKENLESQMRRFQELENSPLEQNRLRALTRDINDSPDSELLRRHLIAYGRWLAKQQSGDREDLRGLASDERLTFIRDIVRDEEERASRRLSADDAKKLRAEIIAIYEQRQADFLSRASRRDSHIQPLFDEAELPQRALMVLSWELRDEDRDQKTRDRLIGELSPEAQAQWNKISRRDQRRRQFQLWRWIMEAMRPSWGPAELERFFAEELDNNVRAHLLSLPTDEMQAQLERLYLGSQFGLRDPDQLPGGLGRRGLTPPNSPPPGESRRAIDRPRDEGDARDDGRRRRDNDR
jgi:hypothetical protein